MFNHGIHFELGPLTLSAIFDANWAGGLADRKSTLHYLIYLGCDSINFYVKNQLCLVIWPYSPNTGLLQLLQLNFHELDNCLKTFVSALLIFILMVWTSISWIWDLEEIKFMLFN